MIEHRSSSFLSVVEQNHAEAESLYLSSNLFHLPVDWHLYEPFGAGWQSTVPREKDLRCLSQRQAYS
jgi:hypothetical protein